MSTLVKPFIARCAIHKEHEYTFKILKRVPNNEIWAETKLTNEQLQQLYDQTVKNITDANAWCATVDVAVNNIAVMPVPLAALTVSEDWCRNKRVDYSRVAEQVCFPVNGAKGFPTIAARKFIDETGNTKITFNICDAVHRATAELERGEHANILCAVTIVDTVKEEAEIYRTINYGRRSHANIDIYKGRVAAGDPKVEAMLKIVRDFGLEMSTKHIGKTSYPNINAINAVEGIYDKYGAETLARTLQLITTTSTQWQCVESLGSDMLHGISILVNRLEIPGFINSGVLEQVFRECTPKIIIQNTATIADISKALHIRVTSQSSQYFRLQAICVALLEQYEDKVRRMKRDRVPGAPTLEKLLKKWHEELAPRTKHQEVIDLHKNFTKKNPGFAHCWDIPDADSGYFVTHGPESKFTR